MSQNFIGLYESYNLSMHLMQLEPQTLQKKYYLKKKIVEIVVNKKCLLYKSVHSIKVLRMKRFSHNSHENLG